MKKTLLYEISIIRPLVIFLLVIYHALCIFSGGWTQPDGVGPNRLYWWLASLISGFRIEAIAFVGGYVFSYQCVELGRRTGFVPFVWKKFKRLFVPGLLFGTLYFMLFRFHPDRFSWNVAVWRVLNGVGHLWFLPMLFWCFAVTWLADRLLLRLSVRRPAWVRPAAWAALAVLAAASVVPVTGLRLGLSRVPHFLFYFALGYWVRCLRPCPAGRRRVLLLWIAYLVFLVLRLKEPEIPLFYHGRPCPSFLPSWGTLVRHILHLCGSVCGILALYFTVLEWLSRHRPAGAQPAPWLRECSRLCYGVYIWQDFLLKHIYYYTPFPQWLCASTAGAWLLPWAAAAAALAVSAVGTWLLLKTRFGRFLIG